MHRIIKILLLLFFLCLNTESSGQSNPSLQFTGGLAFPGSEFAGDLVTINDSGNINISSDFVKSNYAVSTGASITGTLRFPIGRTGLLSTLLTGSYSYFNAFRSSSIGTTIENNISVPVSFDNRFSTTTFAIGIQASPLSGSKISPYADANLSLNILSLSLSQNDITNVIFSDAVRMGIVTNAGLVFKLNNEYGIVLSGSYSISNLFFKNSSDRYSDRIQFYSESIPINDEEGSYYSNLSDPEEPPVKVIGSGKNVNWWSINIGLNIVLGKSEKK